MSNVVEFKRWNAEDRFRDQLMTSIAILRHHADCDVTGDLVEAVENLADDLIRACDAYRMDGR